MLNQAISCHELLHFGGIVHFHLASATKIINVLKIEIKNMFIVFFDYQGILNKQFELHRSPLNAEFYKNICRQFKIN